jgi:hypothetical protein
MLGPYGDMKKKNTNSSKSGDFGAFFLAKIL